jgi:hypothetical protein
VDIHSLFNFPLATSVAPVSAGLRPSRTLTGGGGGTAPQLSTASTFITPQSLATFPLSAGIVATFWQAAQALFGPPGGNYWVCFALSLVIAFVNFFVSISDPKLAATARDKQVGTIFALINGVYLFATAIGIKTVLKQ